MRRTWTAADDARLRELAAQGLTRAEAAKRMRRNHKLVERHARMLGLPPTIERVAWTAAMNAQVKARYPAENTARLAGDLGVSVRALHQRAKSLGVAKSRDLIAREARVNAQRADHGGRRTRFQKGQTPPNKGTRRPGWHRGRMRETQFKKGRPANEARNYRPLGSLRISKDGYLERKVTDDPSIVPARRWTGVHRLVWEAANGPVPAGHVVVFKAGRMSAEESSITLDALEMIPRVELMRRNTLHNRYPKEVCLAIQLRGALNRKINRLTKAEEEAPCATRSTT